MCPSSFRLPPTCGVSVSQDFVTLPNRTYLNIIYIYIYIMKMHPSAKGAFTFSLSTPLSLILTY